jgi:dTDP-4-dehydrorhamnose reductase
MEVWAGVECTINRVGEQFFDQINQSGHDCRLEDLDLIHRLGVRTLRYPFLWERAESSGPEGPHWDWMQQRLDRMQTLGIDPIAGFLHHGSGPAHTSLVDPDFPDKLAAYAAAFARRFPWVRNYTPINEPLTTARFSGLYGLWYPHGRDPHTFLTALIQQCRGIALAMKEIRKVNPAARLIQTEDMGRIWSSPLLAYQARFENRRRWLSFDLLCGKLKPKHPLWSYFLKKGITPAQLQPFIDEPCPPDVIGINYYVTSERFLDQAYRKYPARVVGGNHRQKYADVEAVRVGVPLSLESILMETWERYRLPMAVTEVHLNCTREEQLRWLWETWNVAGRVKNRGADLRAITPWALFGAYNWNNLLTRDEGHYEPGAFDVRSAVPRPTALVELIRDLVRHGHHHHPLLQQPGWWKRPERIVYPKSSFATANARKSLMFADPDETEIPAAFGEGRPVVITGATGTLGQAFARICQLRCIPYRLLTRQDLDIARPEMIEKVLEALDPWAVINAAGFVRVDQAEHEAESCFRENATGPALLAAACARRGCKLLTFSSDLVFDGRSREPYVESSPVTPLNHYGESKARAERLVLEACPDALVVRTSAFFGPWDQYNFVTIALKALREGEEFPAADDSLVSPTYVPDLVNHSLDLLIDGERGIWHLANRGAVTWAGLARLAARKAGLNPDLVIGRTTDSLQLPAARPLYSVLTSERALLMPTLEDAMQRYFESTQQAMYLSTRKARLRQAG